MSGLGNLLWFFLGGGVLISIIYFIGGFLLCCTIVGIPFGIQCIKLAALGLAPFGAEIVSVERGGGCLSVLMNLLWILVGGFWLTIVHLVFGLLCALTIIGIPFARQHVKLASLALAPFGRKIQYL